MWEGDELSARGERFQDEEEAERTEVRERREREREVEDKAGDKDGR